MRRLTHSHLRAWLFFRMGTPSCVILDMAASTSFQKIWFISASWAHWAGGRGQLQYPADVAVDSTGNLYVADFFGNKVVKYSADGSVLIEFGSEGKGAGQFEGPAGIAVLPDGSIWVADQLNNRLQQFTTAGTWVATVTGISLSCRHERRQEPSRMLLPAATVPSIA